VITVATEPLPSLAMLRDALAAFRTVARRTARPSSLAARDPEFIDRVLPAMGVLYDHYFRCRTELCGELGDEPLLVVANHNGMSGTPDMFCLMVAYWRHCGSRRAAYGLMHDVPFRVPWAGPWLNACGAIAANRANARAALAAGAHLLVFPGGDLDACKPYRRRYEIELAGRRGFLRTAIRAGVRIVPVVSAGAHSSLYLLSDGRAIARALGLQRRPFRTNVFPVGFALPYGLVLGAAWPHLPPPVKIHTRIGEPLDLDLPPRAADDPGALDWAYARVVGVMQRMLDQLREEGDHGLWPRSGRWRRGERGARRGPGAS